MFAPYLLRMQMMARAIARRAAFGALGGVLAFIGIVFFGAAIWVYLADLYGAIAANVFIGCLFLLAGFLVLLYSRLPPRVVPRHHASAIADPMRPAPPPPGAGPMPTTLTTASIAQAFILGLTAARAMRRRN